MKNDVHIFRLTRRVQFAETDVAGVLHFSNYYRLMEEAEHALWRSLGMSVITSHEGGQMSWPRVATSCEYFAPAYFEDELDVAVCVTALGERSITFEVDFLRGDKRLAVGRMKAACCWMQNGAFRAISIPTDVRAKLIPLVVERVGALPSEPRP